MSNAIKIINEALNHDTPSRVPWRARLETALFEIERLRAALEDIADHGDMYNGPGLAAIAKLALEQRAGEK